MRRAVTLCIVILCGTVAFAQTGGSAAQPAGGEAAVRQLGVNYVKAMNAGDAKALAALYNDNAVEMPPNQPMVKGRDGIEGYYLKQFAGAMKLSSFGLDPMETRTSGDVGYEVGTYRLTLTPPNGAAITESGKYVVIAKQTAGDWKMTYVIYNSDRAPAAATNPAK